MKNEGKTYKDSVAFYLVKLKTSDKIIQSYLAVSDEDQAELFESAIEYLKQKQDEQNERYEADKAVRRGTTTRGTTAARRSGSPG